MFNKISTNKGVFAPRSWSERLERVNCVKISNFET